MDTADLYIILTDLFEANNNQHIFVDGERYTTLGYREISLRHPKRLYKRHGTSFYTISEEADYQNVCAKLSAIKKIVYVLYILGIPKSSLIYEDQETQAVYNMNFDAEGYCPIYVGQTSNQLGLEERMRQHLIYARNGGKYNLKNTPLYRFLHYIPESQIFYATSDMSEFDTHKQISEHSDLLNLAGLSKTPYVRPRPIRNTKTK